MSSRRTKRRLRALATAAVTALVLAGSAAFVAFALEASVPKNTGAENFTPAPIKRLFIPHLLVIGDSFTGGSVEGGSGETGWPALIQSGYTKDGARLQLNLLGRGGAGYVTKGQIKETFLQSYQGNAYENQDVMVVFGGINDSDKPAATVGAGAAALYAEMRKHNPKAKLIVVGPAWPNSEPVPNIYEVRDAIRTAALKAGATFIDPLEGEWFSGAREAMIGADGTHPNDAGHKFMAGIISKPVVTAVKASVKAAG